MSRGKILFGLLFTWITGLAVFYAIGHLPHHHHALPKTASAFVERYGHIETGMPYEDVVALIGRPRESKLDAATGNKACRWYIGIKGQGDFPDLSFSFEHTNQFIDIVFDGKNDVFSKTLREEFVPDD